MMKINSGPSKRSAWEYRGGKESYKSQAPSPSLLIAGIQCKKYRTLTHAVFHQLLNWFNEENADQGSGGQKYEEIRFFFTQTSPLKFLHILCSQESHWRQPVEGSVPTYQGLERFPESHRRQPVDSSVPPFAFRYWARRLGLNDPPPAAGGIQEYS